MLNLRWDEFIEYFNSLPNKDELIAKYAEIDEDITEEMFIEQDLMYAQTAWNCVMIDQQYELMEQWY